MTEVFRLEKANEAYERMMSNRRASGRDRNGELA